jgi:hypothetical protein
MTEVAVFQGVKIDVMKAGADVGVASRNAPVIAKRNALVRVYVNPSSDYTARAITAELTLVDGSGNALDVLKDTKTIHGPSTDASLSSTFNFDVKGDDLPTGGGYAVALRDPNGDPSATPSGAQYPSNGSPVALGAKSTGDQLKVTVIPIVYGADGSNREPDTSAGQISLYQQAMYTFYPTQKVDISVGTPMNFASAIDPTGNGWDQVLQALIDRRAADSPANDVYYFGAFAPAATFSSFCDQGCVAGLSGLADDPSDPTVRASVGLGYGGQDSTITMAHEVGHAHGRAHAPCGGASSPDPQFPYSGGTIGVWGYDIHLKQLVAPSEGHDLMGYCQPEWISDYTYKALYERMVIVNNVQQLVIGFPEPRAYRFVSVDAQGNAHWGKSTTLTRRPSGELHTVKFVAGDGTTLGTETGHFYRYDHLAGGFLLVPEGPAGTASVRIAGPTANVVLSR